MKVLWTLIYFLFFIDNKICLALSQSYIWLYMRSYCVWLVVFMVKILDLEHKVLFSYLPPLLI